MQSAQSRFSIFVHEQMFQVASTHTTHIVTHKKNNIRNHCRGSRQNKNVFISLFGPPPFLSYKEHKLIIIGSFGFFIILTASFIQPTCPWSLCLLLSLWACSIPSLTFSASWNLPSSRALWSGLNKTWN